MHKWTLLSFLLALLIITSCEQEQQEMHHGSYEAMRMFGAQRAYPNAQIPHEFQPILPLPNCIP